MDNSSNCLLEVPDDESEKQNSVVDKGFINESVIEISDEECNKKENAELIEIKDSDDEGPVVIPIVKCVKDCVDDQDKNSEVVMHSPGITPTKASNSPDPERRFRHNNNPHQRKHHSHTNGQQVMPEIKKSSLLEKLLADDIRHERNVVLQCIRHIVKSRFFGIEDKSPK